MRMTSQREIILEELKKLKSHPTADELYHIVNKRLPRISMATVYRNLEQMSEAGIIKKLEYSGRQKKFDGTTHPHNHIHCIRCGRVADVHTIQGSHLHSLIVDASGFKVLDDQVEFTGICPACQAALQDDEKQKHNTLNQNISISTEDGLNIKHKHRRR